MYPYRQGKKCMCFTCLFCLEKKGCRAVLDSIAESLGLSVCLRESMPCARKEPILPLDRTGMVFLKDGIDVATELT